MVWTAGSALVFRMSATVVMGLLRVQQEGSGRTRSLIDKQGRRMLKPLAQTLHEGRGQRTVDDAVVEGR